MYLGYCGQTGLDFGFNDDGFLTVQMDPNLNIKMKKHRFCMGEGREITVQTNEIGARDKSTSKYENAEKRILLLGDSESWGYGLFEEDTYSTLVERKWKDYGRDIEIINLSCTAHDTTRQYYTYKKYSKQYSLDAVILQVNANDSGLPFGFDKDNWTNRLFVHSYMILFLKAYILNSIPDKDKNWEASINSVQKMQKEIKEPIIIIAFTSLPEPFLNSIMKWVNQSDQAYFLNLSTYPGISSARNQGDGSHLSDEGHQFIAKELFKFLYSHKILEN